MPAAPRRNSEGTGRSGTGRSSVPTTVDTERGSQLQGLELTREQKLQLYRDVRPAAVLLARSRPPREEPLTEPCRAQGFVVLKGVVPRELTQRAKTALREFDDSTAKNLSEGRHPIGPSIIGASAEITDLINASPFTPVLKSLIGEFDPPTATQVAVLPVTDGEESAGFNGAGYPEEGFPFYNAGIHMVTPCSPCFFSCSCPCCSSCSSR